MESRSHRSSNPSHSHLSPTVRPRRLLELFAGVGGFRYGLEQVNQQWASQGLPPAFQVVLANQWEPESRAQHAANVYQARWGDAPVNRDLAVVLDDPDAMAHIDALAPDMLVGGFPCQDYSVAKSVSQSQGLEGKKGVLWWSIHKLLSARLQRGRPIRTLLLENVDRLLNSPSVCRGRDFAMILSSLQQLGYATAWQVVNAADYGYPQRRRRIFLVAEHYTSQVHLQWQQAVQSHPCAWLTDASPLARALPVKGVGELHGFALGADVLQVQERYQPAKGGRTPFFSSGVCIDGQVYTLATRAADIADYTPFVGQAAPMTLGDVVAQTDDVPEEFFLSPDSLHRWQYVKGAKSCLRVSKTGHEYTYAEGAVAFPDPLDRPSRTLLTSEGGRSASRTTHVVRHVDGRLRRLTPEEVEVLTGFPRGFTAVPGISDAKRAFLMGNALVTGLVARIGAVLAQS